MRAAAGFPLSPCAYKRDSHDDVYTPTARAFLPKHEVRRACMQIPEVHAQLQPFLGTTPCSVAQLRAVARRLSDDDSIEVYFDPTEDRVILN